MEIRNVQELKCIINKYDPTIGGAFEVNEFQGLFLLTVYNSKKYDLCFHWEKDRNGVVRILFDALNNTVSCQEAGIRKYAKTNKETRQEFEQVKNEIIAFMGALCIEV